MGELRIRSVRFGINASAFAVAVPMLPDPPPRTARLIHWLNSSGEPEGDAERMSFYLHDGEVDPALLQTSGSSSGIQLFVGNPAVMEAAETLVPWAFGAIVTPTGGTAGQAVLTPMLNFQPPFQTVRPQWLIAYSNSAVTLNQRYALAYEDIRISQAEWVQQRARQLVKASAFGLVAP